MPESEVVVTDVNRTLLAECCQRHGARVKARHLDLTNLPTSFEMFDLFYSCSVLMFLDDAAVEAIARWLPQALSNNGHVVLSILHPEFDYHAHFNERRPDDHKTASVPLRWPGIYTDFHYRSVSWYQETLCSGGLVILEDATLCLPDDVTDLGRRFIGHEGFPVFWACALAGRPST